MGYHSINGLGGTQLAVAKNPLRLPFVSQLVSAISNSSRTLNLVHIVCV
jgi:hypothetical protein